MYSPSLQHLLVQAHVEELHRSGQRSSAQPVATVGRTATRRRRRLQLSIYLSRASQRFAGHPGPEAYAF